MLHDETTALFCRNSNMSSSKEVAKMDTALKNISKAKDIREEMELIVSPYANWEEFLVPAPMSICLLGQLILISTKTDFTLEKSQPKDGFLLLRWPNSFRACLVQVSSDNHEYTL